MRATSHAYGIVAGDENGLVASTTNMTSAFRSPVPLTEQHLDDADIDVLLKQVGGKAVPQGVQRDALFDLRHLGSGVAGAIELARGHRLRRIAAWK